MKVNIQKLSRVIIPLLTALVIVVSVFAGAVPASALASDPYVGGVDWDYYATDIKYGANGVTYTIEPASPGGKSWFDYCDPARDIHKTAYTDSFTFGVNEYLSTLRIYPTGGAGGGARYFYCETLPDGASIWFFMDCLSDLRYYAKSFYIDLYWYSSDGTIIRKDTTTEYSVDPTNFDWSLYEGFTISKPDGASYFDYCFVFPDLVGGWLEDGGWGPLNSSPITVSDVNSYFQVHIPGIDYSKYIVNSYLENNRAVFECDIPDTEPWWVLRTYIDGVDQGRITNYGESFDVSLQDSQDGYTYTLRVFPTGSINSVYSVSSIPVGSDFSATLELTRDGYADNPGNVYMTMLYYDSYRNWISEDRIYLGESDLEGTHTGTIAFEPPEGAEYFLYRFDFENFDCDTDGVSGDKTYWRADTSFTISFPDPSAPAAGSVINYSDYISSTDIIGSGSIVNVSFPADKLKPRWDLYSSTSLKHLDTFIGASGSFPNPIYTEDVFGDRYTIFLSPLGDGRTLSTKNISDGTVLNMSFAFDFRSVFVFRTPTLFMDVFWYDSSGKLVSVDYYNAGSLGQYSDSSGYLFNLGYTLDKPEGASSMAVRLRLQGYGPFGEGVEYSTLSVKSSDFSFRFSCASSSVEQDKSDATNDKLDHIINGTPENNAASDKLQSEVDKVTGEMGSASDKLDAASDAFNSVERPDVNVGSLVPSELLGTTYLSYVNCLTVLWGNSTLSQMITIMTSLVIISLLLFGKKR